MPGINTRHPIGDSQLKVSTNLLSAYSRETLALNVVYLLSNFNQRGYILYTYSTTSERRLRDVHPDLQLLMRVALQIGIFDLTVIEGFRALSKQQYLFATGASKTLYSKHLTGDAVAIEKSFRRIGVRPLGPSGTLWVTEGHFESPAMFAYIRAKRLAYIEQMGRDLGAGDMQYATDCHVRFTHLAELCHQPWGQGHEHMRRVLTDHAPFPRAICRHGGPDTAPYDQSITMDSWFSDLTHNCSYHRHWVPWKKFCCEVPEKVTQYPARPV